MLRVVVVVGAVCGCSGGTGHEAAPVRSPVPTVVIASSSRADAAPRIVERDAGPILPESAARWLLAARFRAAGLRVRQDVRLELPGLELTVDGYDPEQQIGYEYVDLSERGLDLSVAERAVLAAGTHPHRLLIVEAGDEAALAAACDAFFAQLAAP